MNISSTQIQKYEQGVDRIGAKQLERLATLLNVVPFYFFEGLSNERAITKAMLSKGSEDVSILDLMNSYKRIKGKELRKNLLKLVNSMAADEEFPLPEEKVKEEIIH